MLNILYVEYINGCIIKLCNVEYDNVYLHYDPVEPLLQPSELKEEKRLLWM